MAAGNDDCIKNSVYHESLEVNQVIKIRDWITIRALISNLLPIISVSDFIVDCCIFKYSQKII
jgi:hypothetical protein